MKRFIVKSVSLVAVVALFGGCGSSIANTAGNVVGSIAGGTVSALSGGRIDPSIGSALTRASLPKTSTQAQKGYLQSQQIAATMATNPAIVGVSALAMTNDAANRQRNLEAAKKVKELMSSNATNDKYANLLVEKYNNEHNTNFKTLSELQEYIKHQ